MENNKPTNRCKRVIKRRYTTAEVIEQLQNADDSEDSGDDSSDRRGMQNIVILVVCYL
jgi:hypothetical protein